MKQGAENVFLKISTDIALGCILTLGTLSTCWAQGDIAVGSWRFHLPYQQMVQLTGSEATVFGLGENSLLYVSTDTDKPNPLTKLDGLCGHDFSAIIFDSDSKTLLISYQDGTLELVNERKVKRLDYIRSNTLIREKTIYSSRIIGGSAWLAADFGILRVDLREGFIASSFLNLGPRGSTLRILDVALYNDYIFAVTETGVIRGELSSNLNDFNKWDQVDFGSSILFRSVVAVADGLYLLGQNQQLYFWKSGSLEWIPGTIGVTNLKVSGEMVYFSMDKAIYALDQRGNMNLLAAQVDQEYNDFHVTKEAIYLATPGNGITKVGTNSGIYISGPPDSNVIFAQIERQTVAYASVDAQQQNTPSEAKMGVFSQGTWDEWDFPASVRAVSQLGERTYIGTEKGLYLAEGEKISAVTHPLLDERATISALATDGGGKLFIGLQSPNLGLLISEDINQYRFHEIQGIFTIDKILVDITGKCWIVDRLGGKLHMYNPANGDARTFSSQVNNGGLPGQQVSDIFLDADQNLWIATNRGIAYFFNVRGVGVTTAVNAVLPIYENRIALSGMATNQILIAPDRSIWIGSENTGLWHFTPDFSRLIRHFTPENSPLPSSSVRSLSMNETNGELFVGTAAGSLSFRGESIRSAEELGPTLKIYPNPIRRDFNGVLSIEGISDFSTLKITTNAGRLIVSMVVGGGKATWNLTDPSGNRIAPGIYLVYAIDELGRERAAGKFLVH
ncbi:MAG: hypothetical protein GC137_05430 [Alphaproteobacteria bacterium]|nr:hypothetical protein [Alphaproteobacteria bacterium]